MARRGENIYKRKDGRWEARMIRNYGSRGKAVYYYLYGRTCKEVKPKIFEPLYQDIQKKVEAGENDVLFETVLDAWLCNSRIKLKESSHAKYLNIINNHIKPSLGRVGITKISSTLLNEFATSKLSSGKRNEGGGLSEKTVKDIMSVVKSVLKFAKEESLLTNNSFNINLPRGRIAEMRVFSKDEQVMLESYLHSDLDECKLGIILCLYTGLRIGEICALKWSDISLAENTLTVRHTMQRVQVFDGTASRKTKIIITDPKSVCSARIIPLPECVSTKLISFCPSSPTAFFLTGDSQRYIEPRTYQNKFKAYVADSGVNEANFHTTRHTFATRCVEVGFEIKSLSEILGHANVNITLNRYVHSSFDLKRRNMSKLSYLQ